MKRLPCPFCGSSKIAEQPITLDTVEGKDVLCLECCGCGAWGPSARGEYIDDAEAVWNLRDVMTAELSPLFRGFATLRNDEPSDIASGAARCPFCSGTQVRIEDCGTRDEGVVLMVICQNCECVGPMTDAGPDRAEALERWKRRAVAAK